MAEIKKIVCDVCGRDIGTGWAIRPAARRRISSGQGTNGNFRFDICDKCFARIASACKKDGKTGEEA